MMKWRVPRRSREIRVLAFVAALLVPGVAAAGWGGENWGEMVWQGGAPAIPSMPFAGRIVLAVLLLVVSITLLTKRRSVPIARNVNR